MIEIIIGFFIFLIGIGIYLFISYWFGYFYLKRYNLKWEYGFYDYNNISDCITQGFFKLTLLILLILLGIVIIDEIIPLFKILGNYIISLL